jgi:RNA polymerase sigma factor (sigma-70 family)
LVKQLASKIEKETRGVLPQQYEETVALPPAHRGEPNDRTIDRLLTSERAWLVRKCAVIVRNADAAEDLAQETLLEAWRNRHKLHDLGNEQQEKFRRWLAAITRNVCLRWLHEDYHERAHRIIQGSRLAGDTDMSGQEQDEWSIELVAAPDTYDVEIELERAELSALLSQALAHVSEPLRTVLVARYIQGATHDEITEQLQINEATLVQRIYRGKQALRIAFVTHLKHELASYGIYQPGTEPGTLTTDMWCPWCGNGHLMLNEDTQAGKRIFQCQSCNTRTGGKSHTGNWQKVSSFATKHTQLIKWLYSYYWQAIDQESTCLFCGKAAMLTVKETQDLPPKYHRIGDQPGIAIFCPHCQRTHYNTLSHLTFDLPQVQRFWKAQKRIHWQQGERVEHAGIPAVVSTFQNKDTNKRIDVLVDQQTFRVLAINECR